MISYHCQSSSFRRLDLPPGLTGPALGSPRPSTFSPLEVLLCCCRTQDTSKNPSATSLSNWCGTGAHKSVFSLTLRLFWNIVGTDGIASSLPCKQILSTLHLRSHLHSMWTSCRRLCPLSWSRAQPQPQSRRPPSVPPRIGHSSDSRHGLVCA